MFKNQKFTYIIEERVIKCYVPELPMQYRKKTMYLCSQINIWHNKHSLFWLL